MNTTRSPLPVALFILMPLCLALGCLTLASTSRAQEITAYQIADGVVGNQNFGGVLGMDFIVNGNITVTDLGAFDSGSDGINLPITVELWSRNDGGTPDDPADDTGGEVLATAMFAPGDDGVLEGGSRFKPLLADPLAVGPGAYTIVAYGYGDAEMNFNLGGAAGEPQGLTTTSSPALTFVGTARFGVTTGLFPDSPDGGPANRYGAGTFKFTSEDSDDDGMPDVWENEFGLDPNDASDADEDLLDMDGLSNLEEFENDTAPDDPDSDDDNLDDGTEINTTGTDPNNPDTDDDGLIDGIETDTGEFQNEMDTGTDPNNPDSDSDGFGDGEEVELGTDPTDPDDFPEVFRPEGELAYDYLTGAGGTQTFGEGLGHDFIVNEQIRVTSLGVFDSDADGLTLTLTSELWERDDAGTPDNFGDDSGTMLARQEFSNLEPGELFNSNRIKPLAEPLILEPGTYTIVGRGYGAGEPNGNEGTGGPGADFKVLNDGEGLITFVGVSRFGGGGVGVEGFPASADGGPVARYSSGTFAYDTGPAVPFIITEIIFDAANHQATITWNSRPGRSYTIDRTADLSSGPWLELTDGVQSQGESTTYTDEFIPLDNTRSFYRVVEEPLPQGLP